MLDARAVLICDPCSSDSEQVAGGKRNQPQERTREARESWLGGSSGKRDPEVLDCATTAFFGSCLTSVDVEEGGSLPNHRSQLRRHPIIRKKRQQQAKLKDPESTVATETHEQHTVLSQQVMLCQQVDRLSKCLFPPCNSKKVVFVLQSQSDEVGSHIGNIVCSQISSYAAKLPPQVQTSIVCFPPVAHLPLNGMAAAADCAAHCKTFCSEHRGRVTADAKNPDSVDSALTQALKDAYKLADRASASIYLVLIGGRDRYKQFSLPISADTLARVPLHTIALDAPAYFRDCFKRAASVSGGSFLCADYSFLALVSTPQGAELAKKQIEASSGRSAEPGTSEALGSWVHSMAGGGQASTN